MTWEPQAPFILSIKRESSLLNSLALDSKNSFNITKRTRIRDVILIPLTAGNYYYQFILTKVDLSYLNQIAILGAGKISKSTDTHLKSGTNNIIRELIHDGNEKIILHPVIHNRAGYTAFFNFVIYYDLWIENEEVIE